MKRHNPSPAGAVSPPLNLPLSISIIAMNEEARLGRCLESVSGLGREIIVVDSGSTDETPKIAEQYGARFIHNDWPGHVAQKNVALSHCTQPWVLSLDADEALDEELSLAIRGIIEADGPEAGYEMNRLTWFLGDWIWHAWQPEWRLRLVRRDRAEWQGMDPHDYLTISGSTGRLNGYLLHFSFWNLEHFSRKIVDYGVISGDSLTSRGKKPGMRQLLGSPLARFVKTLLLRSGWRDGWRGVLIAYMTLMSGVLKYGFAMEAQTPEAQRTLEDSQKNQS